MAEILMTREKRRTLTRQGLQFYPWSRLRSTGAGFTKWTSSLRKDQTKGTQRTRELSTGNALWSWRNGKERFVRARRGTAGAKPYTMKVVRTVFNGGHEETYGNATRLVPTQRKVAPDIPCL